MRQEKVKTQLYRLGKTVGLEKSEVDRAKKTVMSKIPIGVIAAAFAFIGFFSSRLEAIGLWYIVASFRDFGLFNNFF
jgi:hypothetical protein